MGRGKAGAQQAGGEVSATVVRLGEQARLSAARHRGLQPAALLVVLALYRAFAVLDRDQSEEIARIGLNVTQFNVLMSLYRLGRPLSMGELAALLVVRPTNLSGIVNLLSKRGLVRREINTSDQRSLVARITPNGERLLAGFVPGHWEHLHELMADLDERDRVALAELLRRLIESMGRGASPTPTLRAGRAPSNRSKPPAAKAAAKRRTLAVSERRP